MRKYEHSPEGDPGPPTITITESCDDPGCDRCYVLPDGELGFPEMPPMPRASEMDERMRAEGWANDPLLSKWLCPETVAAAEAALEGTPHVARQAITDTAQWDPQEVAEAVVEADTEEPVPPAEDEPDVEPKTHWLTRYDRDDEPYGVVCGCEIGDDHDDDGDLSPAVAWIEATVPDAPADTEQEDETDE